MALKVTRYLGQTHFCLPHIQKSSVLGVLALNWLIEVKGDRQMVGFSQARITDSKALLIRREVGNDLEHLWAEGALLFMHSQHLRHSAVLLQEATGLI